MDKCAYCKERPAEAVNYDAMGDFPICTECWKEMVRALYDEGRDEEATE